MITLNVGGMLIAGELISGKTYLQEFTSQAEQTTSSKQNDEPLPDDEDRHYIHLRNAFFYMTGGTPVPGRGEGFLWRGRLSAVDGFTMGRLEVVPRNPQDSDQKAGN